MSSGPRPAPTPNPPVQRDQHEFDVIWDAINELRNKKQNRVSPVIWVPLLIWIFSSSVGVIWGAATLNANIQALSANVHQMTKDRYYSKDATKDFALRDQTIAANKEDIKELKEAIGRIDSGIAALNAKIDGAHSK